MKRNHTSLLIAAAITAMATSLTAMADEPVSNGFEYEINADQTATIIRYNDPDTESLVIPAEIDGHVVTAIGPKAFYWFTYLKSVEIPDSVESIGNYAFYWCDDLERISLPENLKSIGDFAFQGCELFSEFTIPENVEYIGASIVGGCEGLTEIGVADGNSRFASVDGVLYDMEDRVLICYPTAKSDASYEVLDGTRCIGENAFIGNNNIEQISLPESVEQVLSHSFAYCHSLTSANLPDAVNEIGDHAFYECFSITEITVPEGVEELGYETFSHCLDLTTIVLPESIKKIADNAFSSSNHPTIITVPGSYAEKWVASNY